VTKYTQDIREAYDAILEDGAMGQARILGKDTYDPTTSQTIPGVPVVVNVPMLRTVIPRSVRYDPESLITDSDVPLLIAAMDDTGAPFALSLAHQLSFAGATYMPKTSQPIAPDGTAIMYDVIATAQ
jgi:hypothetical protein